MRGRLVLTLIAVLASAAAGLQAAVAGPASKRTIEFSVWGDAASNSIEQMVIDAFHKRHPDIQVTLRNPSGNYFEQLLVSIAADVPPDIAIVDFYNLPSLVQQGLAFDVTQWAERDGIESALNREVHPAALAEMTFNGRLYSVANLRIGVDGLFYNTDLFRQAGVGAPPATGTWKWEDMRQAAARLTRDRAGSRQIDQWGLAFHELFVWPFIRMNGGRLLAPDQTRAAFDEPATYEALQWLANLDLESRAVVWNFERRNAFEEGVAGMHVMWVGGIVNGLRRTVQWDWNIAPLPAGEAGSISTVKGNPVVIPVNAKNKEAAWEFMKFLGSEEANYIYGLQGRFFPMHRSALQRIINESKGMPPANLGIIVRLNAMSLPFVPGFSEVQRMWGQELRPVWAGTTSARVAGARIAERSVAILADAKRK